MYQVHSVKIRKEDESAADLILHDHEYDFDDIRVTREQDSNGTDTVTYWIKPYVYEDFEKIVSEFESNGIRVM